MNALKLILGAALSGTFVAHAGVISVYDDGSIRPGGSKSEAACQAEPNLRLRLEENLGAGMREIDESVGSVNVDVNVSIIANCASGASTLALTYSALNGGTATPGADFSAGAATIRFDNLPQFAVGNMASGSFSVSIVDDGMTENAETIPLGLVGGAIVNLLEGQARTTALPAGLVPVATLVIAANDANAGPIAVDDMAMVDAGGSVVIDVLANDSDPEGDALNLNIVQPAEQGLALVVGQQIRYTANADAEPGTDRFVYQVSDGESFAQATVTIMINEAGVPQDSSVTTGIINNSLANLPGGGSTTARNTVGQFARACAARLDDTEINRTCRAIIDRARETGTNPAEVVADALETLASEEFSAQGNAAQQTITVQNYNVGARIAAVRGGARGISLAGLSLHTSGGQFSLGSLTPLFASMQAQADGTSTADDDLLSDRWGFFVNGSFGGGDRDDRAGEPGFEMDTYGLTGGVDYRIRDSLFVGAALTWSDFEADINASDDVLESQGWGLTTYGSWFNDQGWYIDGSLGYMRHDYEQSREIDLSALGLSSETALSDTDASQRSATLGVGFELSRGAWLITPELRAEYAYTEIDGYTEQGANTSGFLLNVPTIDVESIQGQIGLQVARAISTSRGVWQPFGRLDYIHEFADDGFAFAPTLRRDPTQTFTPIIISDPDRNFGTYAVGISYVGGGGFQSFFSYHDTLANDELDRWVIRAGLRFAF